MLNTRLSHAPLTRLAGIAVVVALLGVSVSIAGVVAASDTAQADVSQPNVAAGPASVAGSQPAPAPRIAVVTMEGGKTVSMPLVASSGSDVADPARTPTSTKEPAMAPTPLPVAAQTRTAACSGRLMDATGRAMSGVTVALVSGAMAERVEVRTDEGGQFSITGLPAGEYQVEVKKPGFLTKQGRIVLAAGQQVTQDVVAQIGSLSETVVVQGGGPATANAAPAAPRQYRNPAAPPADPCAQSNAGGCLTPPMKLVDVKPAFPASHATDGAAGTVVVEGRVGIDGFVKDMKFNDGADAAFAASALEAVRQWQFSPVKLNGIPQECRIEVTVKFVNAGQ